MAGNLGQISGSESCRSHIKNQMGSESSRDGIGSNIAINIKKENLLLTHYSGFSRWGIFLNLPSKLMSPHVLPPYLKNEDPLPIET